MLHASVETISACLRQPRFPFHSFSGDGKRFHPLDVTGEASAKTLAGFLSGEFGRLDEFAGPLEVFLLLGLRELEDGLLR